MQKRLKMLLFIAPVIVYMNRFRDVSTHPFKFGDAPEVMKNSLILPQVG